MAAPGISNPIPRLPGGKDIVVVQNKDFTLSLTIIERDELGNAVVVDTTGWVAKMQFRKDPSPSSPVLLEASTADGRIVVGVQGEPGEEINIDIKIPYTAVNAIPSFDTIGWGGCDLRVVYPTVEPDYLLQERVRFQPVYT